eukprot:CAMPEP_0204301776 /NCGR_PEP_ID=MMETSP0468-20130131/80994_1 /ASSEMBLY_ACC=CAM_ASM_000383 /TAXON_ID=2969 /ORGANISM="Oxyrrhis marina" /LENGTH=41 /DNA_ID= /DNA_START= /DNA_END= /DNA_ORIENTATION=
MTGSPQQPESGDRGPRTMARTRGKPAASPVAATSCPHCSCK